LVINPIHRILNKGGHTVKSLMEKADVRSFNKPDEVRTFPKGKLELITVRGVTIGRGTFEPGWKWSESVKPLVNTKSCEAPHFQHHISGTLMVVMDDGTQFECKPGDVSLLHVGHDAWVVGNKPVAVVDFQGMAEYAKSMKEANNCDRRTVGIVFCPTKDGQYGGKSMRKT